MADDTSTSTRKMTFTLMDDGSVRADFPNSGLEAFSFTPATIPESSYPDALTEGVISRLRGFMSKLSGENRTAEKLRAALVAGWEHLQAGNWKVERGEGGGSVAISIEAEAAYWFRVKRAVAKGETPESVGTLEEAAAQFAALSDEQKTKLKALPLYKAAYAEVKARRAQENAEKLAKKAAESEDFSDF